VAWQFAGPDPERRERVALRIIAGSFFALAVYVTVEALRTLIGGHQPEHSTVGIVLVAVSVVIMPLLSWAQRLLGVSSAQPAQWRTRSRRCCAPTCPRRCWSG
jgi:divalent metal cation (Fe/Co/Zn/Cd) transporter